ncbi:MAG: right-handed parallel beta-helix repeat-containing protein [Scytonema sp. PMC 1069.18]|nr:right-handed parallel beta-helix repeat-containing protein [Scytonema sp. PMC 1069.18]MEC4886104.1 right-handed parallel beta-helix repeat-containing protein [Scytonema sp. PMC 1070.18]
MYLAIELLLLSAQILVHNSGLDFKTPIEEIQFSSITSLVPSGKKSGVTYYVSPMGNDNNRGTRDRPWKTVNFAVSDRSGVKAGDTILVQPGTYTEIITLGKSGNSQLGHITLKANGKVTLRDPDSLVGGFREGVIQSAGKGYWVIDGFRVENSSWAGIALRDANNMIVKNNHTYETGASGIIIMPDNYFDGGEKEITSRNIKVLNNTVERANWRWQGKGDDNGTQEALSIWGVDGFEVAYNTLKEGKREGIDAKTGSRNGSIHHNSVTGQAQISGTPGGYNGGPAIYVDGNRVASYNIDIYNNVVYGNTADGIAIGDEVPKIGDVHNIRVYNNVVYNNGRQGINAGCGICVSSNVRNVEIVHNTFVNNVQAIIIDGSDYTGGYQPVNILVRNNIFAHSTYRNGFIQNVNNLIVDSNLFTDTFAKFYESGSGIKNLKAKDNKTVKSVGFVNLERNDFRLTSTSPAINAASWFVGQYGRLDKNGVRRNQGGKPDLGAYEYLRPGKENRDRTK